VIDPVQHFIVDAWPVLEWAKGNQPAAARFTAIIEGAKQGKITLLMSRINHGEVVYLVRKDLTPEVSSSFLSRFGDLPISLLSVSDKLIDAAVELKSAFPISYADAFAAAQAMELSQPLLTGDRDFLKLRDAGLLQLHWLGA